MITKVTYFPSEEGNTSGKNLVGRVKVTEFQGSNSNSTNFEIVIQATARTTTVSGGVAVGDIIFNGYKGVEGTDGIATLSSSIPKGSWVDMHKFYVYNVPLTSSATIEFTTGIYSYGYFTIYINGSHYGYVDVGTKTLERLQPSGGEAGTQIKYGNILLATEHKEPPINIMYGNQQLATLTSEITKTLNCAGKMMNNNLIIADKILNCAGKTMMNDITVSLALAQQHYIIQNGVNSTGGTWSETGDLYNIGWEAQYTDDNNFIVPGSESLHLEKLTTGGARVPWSYELSTQIDVTNYSKLVVIIPYKSAQNSYRHFYLNIGSTQFESDQNQYSSCEIFDISNLTGFQTFSFSGVAYFPSSGYSQYYIKDVYLE